MPHPRRRRLPRPHLDELLELLQDVRRDCEEAQGRADHALRIRLPLFVDEITESLVRIARAFEQ